jgi:hypothetical protein
MAWNDAIAVEWNEHQSSFARTWFVAMVSLRKVRKVSDEIDEEFREAIRNHSTDVAVVEAMLKDAHLIEAARAADSRISSLDEAVRGHFGRASANREELQSIMWVNPVLEGAACIAWLEAGAPEEVERKLGRPKPD